MNYGDCVNFLNENLKDAKQISILKQIEIKYGKEAVIGTLTNGQDKVYENNLYKHLKTENWQFDTRINFDEENYGDWGYIKQNLYTYNMSWMDKIHPNDSYLFGDRTNLLTSIVCVNVGEDFQNTHLEGITNINITDGAYTDDDPDYYETALGDWTQPIYPWGKQLVTGTNKSVKNNVKRYKNFFSIVHGDYGIVQVNKTFIDHPWNIPTYRYAETLQCLIIVVQRKSAEIDTGKFKLSCGLAQYNSYQHKWYIHKYFVNQWYQTPHWTKNLQVFWEWCKIPNGYAYLIDSVAKSRINIRLLPPTDGEVFENFKPFFNKIQMEI